jgi:hypothetical protein
VVSHGSVVSCSRYGVKQLCHGVESWQCCIMQLRLTVGTLNGFACTACHRLTVGTLNGFACRAGHRLTVGTRRGSLIGRVEVPLGQAAREWVLSMT